MAGNLGKASSTAGAVGGFVQDDQAGGASGRAFPGCSHVLAPRAGAILGADPSIARGSIFQNPG